MTTLRTNARARSDFLERLLLQARPAIRAATLARFGPRGTQNDLDDMVQEFLEAANTAVFASQAANEADLAVECGERGLAAVKT